MNKSSQAATDAMEELRGSVEAYLDRAVKKSEAQVCDGCEVELVKTERGLTISRLDGMIAVQAHRTPSEGFDSPDVSFVVSWKNGVSEPPDVNMNLITDGEATPRDITIKDYPWIAAVLGDLIETPHLRVVQ